MRRRAARPTAGGIATPLTPTLSPHARGERVPTSSIMPFQQIAMLQPYTIELPEGARKPLFVMSAPGPRPPRATAPFRVRHNY